MRIRKLSMRCPASSPSMLTRVTLAPGRPDDVTSLITADPLQKKRKKIRPTLCVAVYSCHILWNVVPVDAGIFSAPNHKWSSAVRRRARKRAPGRHFDVPPQATLRGDQDGDGNALPELRSIADRLLRPHASSTRRIRAARSQQSRTRDERRPADPSQP